MKRFIAILLSCLLCAVCFSVFATAEEYGAASLLPDPDGEMNATGCEVTVNDDGSVTITLTDSSASVKMIYKDGTTVYDEPYSEIANYPYIAYWYVSETVDMQALAHYGRKDKGENGADLYLAGMRASPAYFEVGDAESKVAAWNIYDYLKKGKGNDFVTGDWAILKFFDIEYTFTGNPGDTLTLYYYGTIDEIPEDFGVVPEDEDPGEESSDDPVVVDPAPEAGYDFLSTAVNVAVNSPVVGESVRIFTTNDAVANGNINWSTNVVLNKVDDCNYTVAAVYGNRAAYEEGAGSLGENQILLAVHSSSSNMDDIGTYQNVPGKLAALALEEGEKVAIVGIADGNVTVVASGITVGGSSEQPTEQPSEADTSSETPSTSDKPSTPTSDNGIAALAVVAALAVAGAVVVKKSR